MRLVRLLRHLLLRASVNPDSMEHDLEINPTMSKSRVRELLSLWEGILEDASRTYPTLRGEFERDLNRLQRMVASRGIRVFLEDLPKIAKHLDRCLACGQYRLSGLPLTKRYSNRVVIPKFLRGLYLLIFHHSGQLKENSDVRAIFFVRQLTSAFKKGKLSCSAKANEQEVVEFFAVDSALPEPEGFWECEDDLISDAAAATDGRLLCLPGSRGDRPRDPLWISGRRDEQPRQDSQGLGGPAAHSEECSEGSPGTSIEEALREECVRGRSAILDSGGSQEGAGPVEGRVLSGTSRAREALGGRGVTYEGFSRSLLYQGRVSSLPSHTRGELSCLLATLDFVSGVVTATLGVYDPSVWRFRHGPGAVSEYRGPANKYCWSYWPDTLEYEFPIADYGFHSYSSWSRQVHANRVPSSEELCSRMVCVPKTYSKPRLIAAEPSAKMWCQENIWHYFCNRTQSTWINQFVRFRDQTLNQRLCTIGSRDGTLATVDLSAASDRVTCHAVGQMFRKNPRLLNCLRASRTQRVIQTITKRVPSEIRLRKFSTMGNACTFPVESLIFLSIALASVITKRGLALTMESVNSLYGEVAVFGDDLIIPIDSRGLLIEALEVLDFKVNTSKSFWTGKFRESCGVDAYGGVDVTPAYWRTFNDGKPESLASTVDTHNNFYMKGLYSAADRLASTIPEAIPWVHPGSGVFGLKSSFGYCSNGHRTRWNDQLQRTEIRIATRIDVAKRVPTNDDSALLQYFTEDPDPITNWCHGVQQRPLVKIKPRWVALADLCTPCAESN